MDAFGTAVSMSLQYGVPMEDYVRKFSHMRFEPQGHTKNPDIRIAKSLIDYIFRWMGIEFLPGYKEASLGLPLDQGAGASPPPADDELSETQLKPVAMKAGGQKASSEASAGSHKLPTESPKPKASADSRQPTADSPNSERAGSSSTPAPNGNGHSQTNGHGPKSTGNGNAPKAATQSFYSAKLLERAGVLTKTDAASPNIRSEQFAQFQIDAPACDGCGAITVRNGNCYLCHNCGNSMGCS